MTDKEFTRRIQAYYEDLDTSECESCKHNINQDCEGEYIKCPRVKNQLMYMLNDMVE